MEIDNYLIVSGSRAQALIDAFKALNAVAEEPRIFFNPDGLKVDAMDPSHVAMVNLELPGDAFDSYHFSAPMAITVNLKQVLKVLKGINKLSEVTMSLEEGRILFRILDYTREGTRPRAVEKRVPLLEDSGDETPRPSITFRARARIIAKSLLETLKDMRLVSETMSIKIDGDILHFGAHADNYSADSEYERGADDLLEISAEEPSISAFTVDYVSNMVNTASRISEVIELQVSNSTPLKIIAELPHGALNFFVAPCANNDGSSLGTLGAEAVQWDPQPILVYQQGDIPAIDDVVDVAPTPIAQVSPEPIPQMRSAPQVSRPKTYSEILAECMARQVAATA